MKIEKNMIRDCILDSDINTKIDNYIIPLQELSSYMASIFFDYSVLFKTTFNMLKDIDNPTNNISKARFAVSIYHFYKWSETKWDEYTKDKNNKDLTYSIPVKDIGVNFTISSDEIFDSINSFIKAIRKWNLETNEAKWKRDVKNLTSYFEDMFNEIMAFKHILYSIFLKDGSYEYPISERVSTVRTLKNVNALLDDYIGTFNSLYNEIVTIEQIIQSSIDMSKPMNFEEYLSDRGLTAEDIKNAMNIGAVEEVIDDDF
jgi:hypothetical protein